VLELDPTDLRARYELALALLQLGAVKDSETLLSQVVERDPEHAFGDALLRLADVRLRLGAPQPAADTLERFLTRYGRKREALVHLARSLRLLGRHEEARAALAEGARPLAKEELRDPHNRYWRAKAKVASWLAGRPA
jgi:tetratricopeptide (TPR) repeat protein